MRDQHSRREQEWLQDKKAREAANRADLQKKADDFARLDKWYRDELAAEKERHR